jgi:ABC-type oligopeptide transport system ATPase subunit
MHQGKLVETATADDLFNQPTDPYTRKLLDAALDLEGA